MEPTIDDLDPDKPIQILIVEDNRADSLLLRNLIKETGIPSDLTVVNDGEKAIQFIRSLMNNGNQFPDLVLLDINLPKKNGHEVLSFMRKNAGLDDLCIVMCSGSISEEDEVMARLNGANAYLVKPIGATEMERMIESIKAILIALKEGETAPWFK
ncbi:MAG TPA: response regulator [Methanomassiliicoccales archaeon]|jgi:CheY-like chemotaxis protein